MLTRLIIRNFRRFNKAEIDLGRATLFIGPNNSGKTSAMEALVLWDTGRKCWNRIRGGIAPAVRPGITVRRHDLISISVPQINHLWHNLHVRESKITESKVNKKTNIRIDIIVEGITNNNPWRCGFEFEYASEDSFYCRPLRLNKDENDKRMIIPPEMEDLKFSFLPPFSNVATIETHLDPAVTSAHIGKGQTGQVLRNLCYNIFCRDLQKWEQIVSHIQHLFGVTFFPPSYVKRRGEIKLNFQERDTTFDLTVAGRGLQQTLLLLAFIYSNPDSVLLLDEPDAHLEALLQRQSHRLLNQISRENRCQLITTSHSENILNESVDKHTITAFVGEPHRIDGQGDHLLKALKEISFDQYLKAYEAGWLLYLNNPAEFLALSILAKTLEDKAAIKALEQPLVYYMSNNPSKVEQHFLAIREAVPSVRAIAIFGNQDTTPVNVEHVYCLQWSRHSIASYICLKNAFEEYAVATVDKDSIGPLFYPEEIKKRRDIMRETIAKMRIDDLVTRDQLLGKDMAIVHHDTTLRIFQSYFQQINASNVMTKETYWKLAKYVPKLDIHPEILSKLDSITKFSESNKPIS